jgi:ADP-L-glycero-D-manno-heptose 6-epimerase
VARIFPDAAAGRPARLFRSHRDGYADGGQCRDFVWVGDVVAVLLWLLDTRPASGLYNVGSGTARSFADLAAAVYRALGRDPAITYIDMPDDLRARYQYFTEAPLDRLRRAGWDRGFTPLETAVGLYVRDFLATACPYR